VLEPMFDSMYMNMGAIQATLLTSALVIYLLFLEAKLIDMEKRCAKIVIAYTSCYSLFVQLEDTFLSIIPPEYYVLLTLAAITGLVAILNHKCLEKC